MVVEQTSRGERAYDIYSRLLKENIIFLGDADRRHRREPDHRAVAVPRSRRSGARHLDLHQFARRFHHRGPRDSGHDGFRAPDIVTICVGQAASMGAVLLAAGTKGKRFSLPNSRIMIHQPSMQGLAGQAADIDIYAKEILRMREILNKILADASGQPIGTRGARRGSRLHHEPRAGRGLRHYRPRDFQPRTGAGAGFEASPGKRPVAGNVGVSAPPRPS
jgi:ATP-dependent Clp protease protease subunit